MDDFPPLQIVLEDGPLLVLSKPAGLITQGAPPGVPSLEQQVKQFLKERESKPGNVYLGMPHRLDRPVSGIVVFAKNSKAAARLAEQFRERQVRKFYDAIVERPPAEPSGTLIDWLIKDPDRPHVTVATSEIPGARRAELRYEVQQLLADGRALVRVELVTGRMHQIRVQLSHRGSSIVGDRQYGATTPFPHDADYDPQRTPIALHAALLELKHPIRYDVLRLKAPHPEGWRAFGIEGNSGLNSQFCTI